MATTISPKERKPREKKATPRNTAAARKAVASAPVAEASAASTGSASAAPAKMKRGGSAKFDAKQEVLNGMPDVDPRVPELDEACSAAKANKATISSEREELREHLDEIGHLLREHNLGMYIHNGMKFYEEPGSPKIKMEVVKTK